MLEQSHVLVTGGLGAIGSVLCRALLREKVASLTVIDDCSSSVKEISNDILSDAHVTYFQASIADDRCLTAAFLERPQDVVFHLAANFANQNSVEHPVEDCTVNSLGTCKVLEYARRAHVRKFLFTSSSCVYGSEVNSAVDVLTARLDTPYAINKLHGEHLVSFYHEYHGMDTTVLRYFNAFGPGELPGRYRNVVPNFFMWALRGKPLPITGEKTISRDFNYVENAVQATLLAAALPVSAGKIYNVGSGKETRIVELAEKINGITGNVGGLAFHEARRWDSIKHRCADISETVKDLGYAPVIDLDVQLRETYAWLKKHERFFPAA